MSACPTPESYGPPVLCDTTTFPYEPSGTGLAVTGFEPAWVIVCALLIVLVGAVWVVVAAVGAARHAFRVADVAFAEVRHLQHQVRQEQEFSANLETYLPGQPNEGKYRPTGGDL